MDNFITLLEKWHHLNHPYLSGLSSLSLFTMGLLILCKNWKAEVNRIFFFLSFCVGFWFFGNSLSMIYASNTGLSLIWFQLAYSAVPILSVTYYHFYLVQCKKKKRGLLHLLYILCIPEIGYLWFANQVSAGAHYHPEVGIYWKIFSPFTYYGTYGVLKYSAISWSVVFNFWREYKKETVKLRKEQLKYFTIGFSVTAFGAVEWLVNFGIPLHFAWIVIPPFFGFLAYTIVRYKAMEIDTAIHRTILWILTVFLLILPAVIINIVLDKSIPSSNIPLSAIVTSVYLILFVSYYNRLRPRIDHLFRRRKYDYQTILGKVAEVIATTINIEDLTKELLAAVCETMYLRNSILYVLSKDGSKFCPAGRWRYKIINGVTVQRAQLELFTGKEETRIPDDLKELDYDSPIVKWLFKNRDILEREQVEVNPKYEAIKQDGLGWIKEKEIEIIIPLALENKINALLCLGRKENLQAYTRKDLELLMNLGQDIGVTIFNALHYEDLAERKRLDEEIKMGRDIQIALLPKDLPQLPGISISGLMLPANEIGGDYYDFIALPQKGGLGIVIGDVSGKGVAAGLVMAMTKTAIHTLSQEETSPRQILLRTNDFLNQSIGGYKGMTLLYLVWQAETKTITYSSAGHEHILIYRASNNNVEAIISGGIMLGMPIDISNFLEDKQFSLYPGDKILLYTDGVTEAENKQGERFGLDRLKETFKKYSQKNSSELIQAVKDEVYSFIGNHPQYDDITLVTMEEKG